MLKIKMYQKPLYVISIVSELLGLHPQTLRQYEKLGLIEPSRTQGKTRLYSEEDVERLKYITTLTRDMGVNLAGVEIIMQMREQIEFLTNQLNTVADHIYKKYGENIKLNSENEGTSSTPVITKVKIERED